MPTPRSGGLVRIFRRAALVTLALGGITLGSGFVSLPSASAHDELVSSNPQQGDELATAPESIDLAFSADILDLGAAVLVVDSTSTDRTIGVPELAGNTLTQTVADLDDGAYQVRWRVVSGDGHPIAGSFDFIVGDPASAEPITAAASAPSVETATPDAAPGNLAGQPEPSAGFWAMLPVWQYALIGAAGGLGMFALVLRLRRAR
ncbi:hypothetical protein DDA93_02380 [Arthrobacter sp. Bz4]|nr:hypothetical protein DDA93_02380 [Arthrobacter sp. Bz4]